MARSYRIWALRLLLYTGLLYLQAGCSTLLAASQESSATVPLFPEANADFERHRQQVRDYLAATSMSHRSAADIDLNLPFDIPASSDAPYRGRFLLFHGLNDSAYVWRDLATALAARGFDTRSVLLAGHGNTPEDMLDVDHRTWLRAARQHLAVYARADTPLFLGGFSMGATLATWLTLEQPDAVSGLFLLSPAFHSSLDHLLRWSGIYKRFRPWVFGGMIHEDNPIKYNSIPVNSGWQFHRLTRTLKRRWRRQHIDIPVLMVASADDSVVDVSYTRRVFQRRFTHPQRELLLYRVPDKAGAPGPHERWRDPRYPSRRILNQSHLGIMYSPDNPLFGRRGRVLVCNGNEFPIFMACMRAREHWFGAQHTPSPDGTAVARTTYNEDFDGVLERFDAVFQLEPPTR